MRVLRTMAADRIVAPNLPTPGSKLLLTPRRRRSSHRLRLPPRVVRRPRVDATTVAREVVADAVVAALVTTVAVVAEVADSAMAETAAQLPLTASLLPLTPRRAARVATPKEAVGTAEVGVTIVVTEALPLPTKVATTLEVSSPAALVVEAAVAAVVDVAAAPLQAIHTRLLIAPTTEEEVASSRHVQRRVISGSWNGMASICCRGS